MAAQVTKRSGLKRKVKAFAQPGFPAAHPSDALIQQILGHGIAAKLSARLGEGMLNGLLTARLGLAAIEVIRPLPFTGLSRPTLRDLMSDALRRREDDEASQQL